MKIQRLYSRHLYSVRELLLLLSVLLVSACSGSSDAGNNGVSSVVDTTDSVVAEDANTLDTTGTDTGEGSESNLSTTVNTAATDQDTASPDTTVSDTTTGTSNDTQELPADTLDSADNNNTTNNPLLPTSTRIEFNITVPAYVSNTLQVELSWGDIIRKATWRVDEQWTVSDDFPVNTEQMLSVLFTDGNGDIVLASHERLFKTPTIESAFININADQFDTARWDNDSDGVSNLAELITGADPSVAEPSEPQLVSLAFLPDKTFRLTWTPSTNVQFYRILENVDGVSGFVQVGKDIPSLATVQSSYRFDHRVALYRRLNAAYLVQACNAQVCVDSNIHRVSGSLSSAVGYFKASNSSGRNNPQVFSDNVGDRFGSSVSISADGETMAVAAPFEDSSATGVNGNQNNDTARFSGAVYVFKRANNIWQQQAYIKASNTQADDLFGDAISLSADGLTLAVGAPAESSASATVEGTQSNNDSPMSGAVYIFVSSNGSWQQESYIKANSLSVDDKFGGAVSLSANGDLLVVGAIGEDSAATGVNGNQEDNTSASSGAVYVFSRENKRWQQDAYLKASNTGEGDYFGDAVSVSGDGNTLAVGARREDSASFGINGNQTNNSSNLSGAVYVFSRIGDSWQQQAYVKASNTGNGDMFGSSVALSETGNTLVVAAPTENSAATGVNGRQNDNSLGNAGAAYVFTRVDNNWRQQAYLKSSNTSVADGFGSNISISADAQTVAVSAYREASSAIGINGNQADNFSPGAGAVYLFVFENANWRQQAYVKASNADSRDDFGSGVSLSADGNTLAVGASIEASSANGVRVNQFDNSALGAGAVYLY